MYIRPMSDLHIEFDLLEGDSYFHPKELPTDKDTVLVLAGDINVKGRAIKYANILSKRFKAVVLVAGNHDYWGANFSVIPNKWLEEANDNVHPLFNNHVVIDDVVFVGGTLWTDYNDHDELCMWDAKRVMVDYSKIRYGTEYKKFTPTIALYDHKMCINSIKEGLSIDARKHVVVTHMTPSYSCEDPSFYNEASMTKHYYHSNLDWLVPEADMWIFGHTHYCVDKEVGDKPTRLLANQRGYSPDYLSKGFREDLVVEV